MVGRLPKDDVEWRVHGRKTPIAYSTKAARDLIVALAEPGLTIGEVLGKIIYDQEAKEVLRQYVARGYSGVIAREWFGYEDSTRLFEPAGGAVKQTVSVPKWTDEQLEEAYRIKEHQYRIEDAKQMLGWLYERKVFGAEARLAPEIPDILEAVVKEYEKRIDCNEAENTAMQNACEAVMKSIWKKFPGRIKPGTYNIGFTNGNGRDDETQFDPEDIGELKALWMEFCKDNNFNPKSVTYIEESKGD